MTEQSVGLNILQKVRDRVNPRRHELWQQGISGVLRRKLTSSVTPNMDPATRRTRGMAAILVSSEKVAPHFF